MKKLLVFLALLFASLMPAHAQNVQAKPTVNGSIVIGTGNTFQIALASVTRLIGRIALTIQNNNTNTDNCWISFGTFGGTTITAGNATKGRSIVLVPGGSYTRYWPLVPSDEIEATCTGTSDTLYVDTM